MWVREREREGIEAVLNRVLLSTACLLRYVLSSLLLCLTWVEGQCVEILRPSVHASPLCHVFHPARRNLRYIGIAKQGPTFDGLLLAVCNRQSMKSAGNDVPALRLLPGSWAWALSGPWRGMEGTMLSLDRALFSMGYLLQ
jgi:hypothetical protein